MARMKKILALTMAAMMGMSMLAGCGDKKDEGTSETTGSTEATEAASLDETESTEAETTESTTEAEKEAVSVKAGDTIFELNFDDNEEDECHTYSNGGTSTLSAENGELCLDVQGTGTLDYANQIYYDGFELYEGCEYELSFDVHSTVERGLQYRIQINGGDYHAYVMDDITIGTETQHISNQFTMSEASDPAPRLCMNLGHFENIGDDSEPHKVYFDNIVLKAVDVSNAQSVEGLPESSAVNINQVGYKTDAKKIATVTDQDATKYQVIDVSTGKSVKEGDIGIRDYDSAIREKYALVDFSDVKTAGTYKIALDTGAESFEFVIGDDIYSDMYKDVVLMLYNQRCGTDLDESVSADFSHKACHTGSAVVYGTDTALDVTGGWHDAGDYGRYVVPGAKTVQDLLLSYQDVPEVTKDDSIGIPESGNGVPDILDEARYELDWMLKMQDAVSGGVYHKVTCEVFPETVLAVDETAQLFISPISNTATGDFAAVMAKASVVYKDFDADFAAKCLAAAQKAWTYLKAHEGDAGFKNVGNIVTGEYPDSNDGDEYFWAAVELYIATGDETYNDYVKSAVDGSKVKYGLGWADVGYYGVYDYCVNVKDCDAEKEILKNGVADLVKNYAKSSSGVTVDGNYVWGSNMVVADNGMLLLMASKVLGDDSYIDYAADQLNYLLGRNAVSYCYVTGYGTRSPLHTHHRPSQVLDKSMPGMLVGGANANLEDAYAVAVLSGLPGEKCYADNAQSYSCNEVTIYWNSPLIYLIASFK